MTNDMPAMFAAGTNGLEPDAQAIPAAPVPDDSVDVAEAGRRAVLRDLDAIETGFIAWSVAADLDARATALEASGIPGDDLRDMADSVRRGLIPPQPPLPSSLD